MIASYVVDSLNIANWKLIFDDLETGKTSLWHCTYGKDRAGMTTVLVLSSLGVSIDTCIVDFMKSNEYMAEEIERMIALQSSWYASWCEDNMEEYMRPYNIVEQEWIEVFINDINTNHGGMSAFLEELDVDIWKMQDNFLEK